MYGVLLHCTVTDGILCSQAVLVLENFPRVSSEVPMDDKSGLPIPGFDKSGLP